MSEWELWARIIEDTGDVQFGHLAMEALEMDNFIDAFRPPPAQVSALAWDYVKTVRAERNRREAQRTFIQNQEARNKNNQPR